MYLLGWSIASLELLPDFRQLEVDYFRFIENRKSKEGNGLNDVLNTLLNSSVESIDVLVSTGVGVLIGPGSEVTEYKDSLWNKSYL